MKNKNTKIKDKKKCKLKYSEKKTKVSVNSDVRKKALMWLALFPPYGLYLLIKNKMMPWGISIVIGTLFIIIGLISYDMVTNPHRVEDIIAKKTIEKFNTGELGDVRILDRKGTVTINERKYHKYNVYTNVGTYYFFLGSIDGKEYIVEGVYKIEPERKLIYTSELSKDIFTDMFPEIKQFLSENESNYGKIIELVETFDSSTQKVKTDKGNYRISVKFEQVVKVVREEGVELIEEFDKEPMIDLLPGIKKNQSKLEKIAGKVYKVVDYENISTKRVQYIQTEKGLFKVDLYDDGSWQIFEYMHNSKKVKQ